MEKPRKFKEIRERKSRKSGQWLIFWVVAILALFFWAAMMYIGVGDAEWAGMTVSNLTGNQAVEYGLPQGAQGVVIKFVEDQAYYSGVKEGDLLKAILSGNVEKIKSKYKKLIAAQKALSEAVTGRLK